MDVKLPNGVIVNNVPDDITQSQLQDIAIKNNLAKPEDFGIAAATPGEALQRGAGLAARAAITGASAIPNAIADFASGLYNLGANVVGSSSRAPYLSQEQQKGLTQLGLPSPETMGEKAASGAIQAVSGGLAQTPLALASKASAPLAMATPAATAATAASGAIAPVAYEGLKDYTGSELAATLGSLGMSTVGAGLAGRMAGAVTTEKNPKVTMEEVKQRAQRAYTAASDAGITVKPQSALNMVSGIQKSLDDIGFVPELPAHKPIETILNKFNEIIGTQRVPLDKLEKMRSLASNLQKDPNGDTRRLAGIVVNGLDDYMSSIGSKDIMTGTTALTSQAVQKLLEARKDWRNLSRASILEDVLTKSEARALNPSASESELIRQGFIGILGNENRRRLFSSDELAAMKAVAGGTPLDTALSMLGKLSPERSKISSVAAIASGQPYLQAAVGGGLLADKVNSLIRSQAAKGLISDVLSGNVQAPPANQGMMRGLLSVQEQRGLPSQAELNSVLGLTPLNVDPLTLLAMANGAVAAVKKGCQLYKDIKNAAGDVSAVLKDIDAQFSGKKVSKEQAKKIAEKKEEVRAIANTDPNDVISQVGNSLSDFFTAYDQIEDLFYAEEQKSLEVYEGDDSVNKRALQRVLIRLRLDEGIQQMRDLMIYHCPPEMKDLWGRFSAMREQINQEQAKARAEKFKRDQELFWEQEMKKRFIKDQLIWLLGTAAVIGVMVLLMVSIKLHKENSLLLWYG